MTKKQCILIGIISAILASVFIYAVYNFPHVVAECLFWFVSFAFCFGCFYLLIAVIWTKCEILPNPYPVIYPFDPDIEEKMKIQDEMKKEKNK
jgi:hypothetical protein